MRLTCKRGSQGSVAAMTASAGPQCVMSRERITKTRPVIGSAWAAAGKEIANLSPGCVAVLGASPCARHAASKNAQELFHLIGEPVIPHAGFADNNLGSRFPWGDMADGQRLPQLLHAFECIGSISHYLDQGIVFRLEKSLIDSHL
jgi:hypothetical protein